MNKRQLIDALESEYDAEVDGDFITLKRAIDKKRQQRVFLWLTEDYIVISSPFGLTSEIDPETAIEIHNDSLVLCGICVVGNAFFATRTTHPMENLSFEGLSASIDLAADNADTLEKILSNKDRF